MAMFQQEPTLSVCWGLMSRTRVFEMLLWAIAISNGAFAGNNPCVLLAATATEAQITLINDLQERDASHRDNVLHVGRAAERLLYIATICPEQFSSAIDGAKATEWFGRWQTALRDDATLQPQERVALIAAAKAALRGQGTHAKRATDFLDSVSAVPPRRMEDRCGGIFRHLFISLLDDWMSRDGALWFDYSPSLLFMLALCPDDSYYVLDQRPEVLSSWLHDLPKASFWGEPGDRKQLEALQQALVQLLEAEHPPEYLRGTHDQIMHRLRKLCVTTVDETTPCQLQSEQ
jgi:hypothetical protein